MMGAVVNDAIQKAFFVISDITGYTMFLSRSELDHAQEILKALFNSQLSHIRPPIFVSNFQGDAIFMYIPEKGFIQEQTLIEMIEGIYFAFARQLDQMRFGTTCRCNACANMGALDLKLFIHYGECMTQNLGDREELIGADVILIHRMLKNSVIEKTDIQAYALFSNAAAEVLHLQDYCDELVDHSEEYEHVGTVEMLIHPLEKEWRKELEKRRVIVDKADAWLSFEDIIPASPALTWDYLTQMNLKTDWMGVDIEERIDSLGGRSREGSSFHCAHGDQHIFYQVVDWEPMHHVTFNQQFPNVSEVKITYLLQPRDESSTRLCVYSSRPEGDPPESLRRDLQELLTGYLSGLRRAMSTAVGSSRTELI
jgi:uncharacterized protein YndB with AHSA1/START domain